MIDTMERLRESGSRHPIFVRAQRRKHRAQTVMVGRYITFLPEADGPMLTMRPADYTPLDDALKKRRPMTCSSSTGRASGSRIWRTATGWWRCMRARACVLQAADGEFDTREGGMSCTPQSARQVEA